MLQFHIKGLQISICHVSITNKRYKGAMLQFHIKGGLRLFFVLCNLKSRCLGTILHAGNRNGAPLGLNELFFEA
ncbi:hypothetical protein HanIR_Chr02g0089601 [Helianthus annuus]|nr:hypothetical protein HanIR_Chr02g0089601 [Helianthus annuus]